MEWFVAVLNFIGLQILNVPAYLIGIITAIGLIALRRKPGQVIGGGLKAALGFLILGAGANVVIAALAPLGDLILAVTGAQGVIPTNEVITAIAAEKYGTVGAYVLVLGFIVMLLLARFTPLRYIFLTGHHMVFMSIMITVVLSVGLGDSLGWLVVPIGAILLGVIMVVMPAFAQPWTRKITGDDTFAIGHFGSAGYIAAGAAGQLVGGKSRSTEEINFPQNLRFLRDSMVATALSMVLIYWVFAIWGLIALPTDEALKIMNGSADAGAYMMAAFGLALQFGVGVAIILYGVRTVLGELIPAFQGIAEKVVPGALPALDIPMVYPFAANAVLIGFISSFVGGLVMLVILATWLGPVFGLALILPGMVPHFFTGGGAGVYGNATGGRRGAVLGGFVNGLLITILPATLLTVFGSLGFENSTFGDADFGWFGTLIGTGYVGGPVVGIIVSLVVAVVLVIGASIFQVKVVNTGWVPGAKRDALIAEEDAAAAAAKEATTGTAQQE